jgi:hypothetical protein
VVELLKHQTVERKLIDSGLIAISLIIMQDWIATGTPDRASFISLISFAVAIPMLASDLLILQMPKTNYGKLYFIANHLLGMILAFAGVGAAIFHVSLAAGIVFLISCVLSYAGYALIYNKNFTEKNTQTSAEQQPR